MNNKQETAKRKGSVAAKRLLGILAVLVCVLVVSSLTANVLAEGAGSLSGTSELVATTDVTTDATTSLPEDAGEGGSSVPEEQQNTPAGAARGGVGPQDAGSAGITTYWEANNGAEMNIEANTSQTFFVGVGNGESVSGTYELKITVKNADGFATDTGFIIGGYSSVEALNGAAKSVSLSADGATLTYVLDDNFSYVGIPVTLNARVNKVYPNEKATVTVALYKNGSETALYTGTTLTATATYKQLDYAGPEVQLSSPAFLPVGENSGANAVSAVLRLYAAGGSNVLTYSGAGTRVYGTAVLDFSNVNITVGTVTKTYTQWKQDPAPYANSPVTFLKADGTALDTNNTLAVAFNDVIYLDAAFTFETSADFKVVDGVSPKIVFNIVPTLNLKVNNRGPVLTAVNYSGTAPSDAGLTVKLPGTSMTAQDALTKVSMRPSSSAGTSIPYLHPNSVSFLGDATNGFRYYQELFRVEASSPKSSGQDTTITFTIPDGVTVTHIRIPNKDQYSQYTSVEYNGVTYAPGSVIETGGLAAGADVTLKINGLASIVLNSSGYSFGSYGCGIQFAGTTSGLTEGQSVSFGAVLPTTDPDTEVSSFSTKVSAKYQMDPSATNNNTMLRSDSYGAFGGAVEKGSSFNMYMSFNSGSYAYTGTTMANPSVPSFLYADPVLYFSVPAGLDVGDVVLSNAIDYYGKTVAATITNTFENAGEFAASGGKLVEVKLHEAGDPDGHIWLIRKSNNVEVHLELTVPSYYTGPSQITFPATSVLLGTWNSGAVAIGTNGSAGKTAAIANAPGGTMCTVPKLAYAAMLTAKNVEITAPQTVSVNVGVRNGSNYLSYNPANPDTTPEMMAGSNNGQYRVYVYNGLSEAVTDGVAYFMVPKHASWATTVNGAPSLTVGGGADAAKVYVTTNALAAAGSNTTSSLAGETWHEVTFTSGVANLPAGVSSWEDVTGFKYAFSTLPKGGYIDMYIPFGVPAVSGSVQYDDVAIGQTLYDFGSVTSQNATTAAVKLVKSEVPVVMGLSAANAETDVNGQTTNVEYKTGTLPNWASVAVYDDFTAGLQLAKVTVAYTPGTGSTTAAYTKEFTTFGNTSYTTTQSGAYVAGNISTITDTQNAVSNSVLGTYVITYTSTKDADDQETTMTRTIVVRKSAGSVAMVGGSAELFTTDAVPAGHSTWQDYFKTLLAVTDSDGFDLATQGARLVATNEGGFDAGVPGVYTLAYTYTDIVGNTATANMVATVKLAGSVGGSVTTPGGTPVPGVTATLTGGGNTNTGASGNYSFDLQASATSPATVDYELTFSNIPAGLKIPASATASGNITTAAPAATANLELTPIAITANLGTDAADWASAVVLYTGGGTLVESKTVEAGTGSYTFTSATWFSGDYYLQITLKEGYQVGAGGDFAQNGAGSLKTAGFTVANDDIAKTATALPIAYTLSFSGNGAASGSVGSMQVNYNDSITLPANGFVRAGYSFEGWATSAGGPVVYADGAGYTQDTASDVTLHAVWKQITFTVRFEDGDGNLIKEEKVNLGDSATPPTPPERYGYIFKGWSGNYTNVQKDELVVAVYQRDTNILPETVTVTFDYNDGRGTYTSVTVSFGDGQNNGLGANMPADPSGSSAFSGWNRSPDGNGAGFTAGTSVTSNITVYAQWGNNNGYYTLSFNLNGVAGTPPASQSLRAGSLATAVASPTSDNYTFEGWNTAADGSGSGWNFGSSTMPARNVTLYAQWSGDDSSVVTTTSATSNTSSSTNTSDGSGTPDRTTGQDGSVSTINIGGSEIPLFGSEGHWGLLNLIFSGVGVLLALAALITYFTGRSERKKRLITRIVAIAIAVASVAAVLITQNFNDTMALSDNWTALILALLVGEVVFVLLSRGRRIPGDDDGDEELYGKTSHSYTAD